MATLKNAIKKLHQLAKKEKIKMVSSIRIFMNNRTKWKRGGLSFPIFHKHLKNVKIKRRIKEKRDIWSERKK